MELLLNLGNALRTLFEIPVAIISMFVFAFVLIASVGLLASLIAAIVL